MRRKQNKMISVDNLSIVFGGHILLNNISFVIGKKERIALVGKNGAGKSTLLKTIAGYQTPTSGNIALPKDITVGYLPQQMELSDIRTVREEAEQAFDAVHRIERQLLEAQTELADRTDYESESYYSLIDKVNILNEDYLMMGGANYMGELEKTLLGLGFRREDFDRPTAEFSGGWRMRIELAKLLLRHPDVLLLDEPTNHLDIESIQWIENFLTSRANAVVLVSHDRAFIDAVTRRTIEISLGRIYDYRVNYSEYVELRKERREQQIRAYENQRKQIQDTEAFIERFRYKATKAVQVQSRIKQLEKLDLVEVDMEDSAFLNLKFPPAPRSGSYPVVAENLAKAYGTNLVFSAATFTIARGDKVAFVGKNGAGKSTLAKSIIGQITDYAGTLTIGHNVKIGYFAQNQAQLLDDDLTVFETVDYVAQGDIRTKIRDILGAFMFGGEASDKKVKVLSGGERSRLAMIRLLLEPVNLLILDEPTNHLDMQSKDVLKNALRDFNGTIIVVSHDREFLDGLVDKVYEFGDGRIREHLGGIYDFLEKKKLENLVQLERKDAPVAPAEKIPDREEKSKLSYEERKEFVRQLRKLENQLQKIEESIKRSEQEIHEIEQRLSTPEEASSQALYDRHNGLKSRVEHEMEEWTLLTMELEEKRNEEIM